MKTESVELACTVDVKPGEKLTLPSSLVDGIGPGRWVVIVRPYAGPVETVRRHDAFLHGYAPQDGGCTTISPGEFWLGSIPYTVWNQYVQPHF